MTLVTIKNISPKNFEYGLLISAGIFSIIFMLDKLHIIKIGISILNDNFIKQIYGHSYLADLLVLTFPFIISKINLKLSKSQKYLNYFLLLFFFTTLIITNSRSGFIAIIIGLLFLHSNNKIQKLIKILIFGSSILFLIISSTPQYQNKFEKTLVGERNKYWSIAINGFLDSPIIGNGPNTFSIIRRQKQDQPIITSVAHSSIFSFLCENGLIFTIFLFAAIIYALHKTKKSNNIFFVTSIIVIIHSLLDPTWNAPGIFIISLYSIFYYSPIFDDSKKVKTTSLIIFLLAFTCLIFFVLDTISNQFLQRHQYESSLKFNPFNLNARIETISKVNIQSDLWQKNLNFTLKYFGKNEIVYKTLINIIPFPKNEKYYYQIFELNPKENYSYYLQLLNSIKKNNDSPRLETLFDYFNNGFDEKKLPVTYVVPISKESYNYAINIYQKDKIKALKYFKLSVKLVPDSGFYQVDLANALWNSNQKEAAINQLTTNCQKSIQAKDHCSIYLNAHLDTNFNQPGTKEYVNYINNVLK